MRTHPNLQAQWNATKLTLAPGNHVSKEPVSADVEPAKFRCSVRVERDGQIRRRIVAEVTTETIETAIREEVDRRAHLMTDEFSAYRRIGPEYAGHSTVCHSTKEYARGDVHTNTAESSHALVKRGIVGIYHNVSREYLHRYLWHFDFLWNNRQLNDGERTILAIQSAEGKRLMYKPPVTRA